MILAPSMVPTPRSLKCRKHQRLSYLKPGSQKSFNTQQAIEPQALGAPATHHPPPRQTPCFRVQGEIPVCKLTEILRDSCCRGAARARAAPPRQSRRTREGGLELRVCSLQGPYDFLGMLLVGLYEYFSHTLNAKP